MSKHFHLDPGSFLPEGLRGIGIKVPSPEDDVQVFKRFLEQNPHLKEGAYYQGEERRMKRNGFYTGSERRRRNLGIQDKPDSK